MAGGQLLLGEVVAMRVQHLQAHQASNERVAVSGAVKAYAKATTDL